MRLIKILIVIFLCSSSTSAQQLTIVAQKGYGVIKLLRQYKLEGSLNNIEYFQKLNAKNFDKNGGLLLNTTYIMPVSVVKFDGNTIRSTLEINDYELAKKIEDYNILVQNAKIKKGKYQDTKELWVPYDLYLINNNLDKENKNTQKNIQKQKIDYSYLLKDANTKLKSKKLKGFAFYIIAGHGGPDPGAIANYNGNELHEHEYAYDVSIRLTKKLMENGADVYMIVQDAKDGIREDAILKNGGNEKLINGDSISAIQIDRLKQRTDIVNDYYTQNKNIYKQQQLLIEIHIDSRDEGQRVDIFFYHRDGSKICEKLNNTLLKTIENKYNKAQPGRGYKGKVSTRDLFTLRNTTCDATFIELGNIQNTADQQRFINPNNRQAIANWLYNGILLHYGK